MTQRLSAPDLAIATLTLKQVGGDDYEVVAAGLVVGQIMARRRSFGRKVWFWSVAGPHLPETMAGAGSNAMSLGGAKAAVKSAFDTWLQSATGKPSDMAWSTIG